MHHLILLHGMGDFDPEKDFYTPFRQKLEGVLREQGKVLDQIVRIHPIDYSDSRSIPRKQYLIAPSHSLAFRRRGGRLSDWCATS